MTLNVILTLKSHHRELFTLYFVQDYIKLKKSQNKNSQKIRLQKKIKK